MRLRRKTPGGPARGSRHAGCLFARQLEAFGMRALMSRKGDCRDNAAAGSLFGSLKSESLDRHGFVARRAARNQIMAWIATCSATRLHPTPVLPQLDAVQEEMACPDNGRGRINKCPWETLDGGKVSIWRP